MAHRIACCTQAAKLAGALAKGTHYTVDEKQRNVLLTEEGYEAAEDVLQVRGGMHAHMYYARDRMATAAHGVCGSGWLALLGGRRLGLLPPPPLVVVVVVLLLLAPPSNRLLSNAFCFSQVSGLYGGPAQAQAKDSFLCLLVEPRSKHNTLLLVGATAGVGPVRPARAVGLVHPQRH